MKYFIVTKDPDVANQLSKFYNQIESPSTDIFFFVNDSTVKFAENIDASKISFTDKLFL